MNILLSRYGKIKRPQQRQSIVVTAEFAQHKNASTPVHRGRSVDSQAGLLTRTFRRRIIVVCSLPSFPVTGFHPKHNDLVHTAAVPSGTFTRLSILSRCYTQSGTLAKCISFRYCTKSKTVCQPPIDKVISFSPLTKMQFGSIL